MKLERIKKGLEKKGIYVEIQNMSVTINEKNTYTKEDLEKEIERDGKELAEWINKKDWVMVSILVNRIQRKTGEIFKM